MATDVEHKITLKPVTGFLLEGKFFPDIDAAADHAMIEFRKKQIEFLMRQHNGWYTHDHGVLASNPDKVLEIFSTKPVATISKEEGVP